MKVLIIGNGFLGSAITERLVSDGHDILTFSRTWNPGIKSRQVLGDIFDFDEFVKVLAWEPEVVIHTSWITTPGLYKNDPSNFGYADFTIKLARTVESYSVGHLIVLGTCAEYGIQKEPSTSGVTKVSPTSLYARQKVNAFESAQEALRGSKVRFTWARVFYPYGPNQNPNRLIPRLIQSLDAGEPVSLFDTSSIYDWVTSRDVASAISWTLENDLPVEIDIGTTVGYTNLELLAVLEKVCRPHIHPLSQGTHEFGLDEVLVAGSRSPLFASGWLPKDNLTSGLEWMLSNAET
jgi:nucleoside-diphosphate-sugar epimerase